MRSIFMIFIVSAVVAQQQSKHLAVTDGVANFFMEVMVRVFNATRVDILVASNQVHAARVISSKLHLSAIVTSTVRITSNEMTSGFLKRVHDGLPTNTKFYVICLLSLQEYLQHLFPLINQYWTHMIYSYWIVLGSGSNFARLILQQKPCTFYFMTATKEDVYIQGYVLLGPSYARRNNCSGLLTIAQAPNTDGVTGITHTSPAKEEPSGVLRLSCILSEYERKARCHPGVLEEMLQVMKHYLNITKFVNITVGKKTGADDVFRVQEAYSHYLIHGVTDVLFAHIAMAEYHTTCTEFVFTLEYHKLIYLYPSPRALKSSFTVLKIFSVAAWCSCGISLGLIGFVYRTITYFEERLPRVNIVGKTFSSVENRVKSSRKLSMRTLLMAYLLLGFIIGHCLTGGYISFLNKPIMEEAPDTKERLLAFLRNGRLQFCMSKYAFVNGIVTHSNHTSVKLLRNLVHNWSQFKTTTPDTCLKRTRERQAVYFGSSIYLENYAASCEDQVQISRVFADDVMCPASVFLPKASPYKELLDNAAMRIIATGLKDKMAKRYWDRAYPRSRTIASKDAWHPLQLNAFMLPFIVLAAGLAVSWVTFLCEFFAAL